jgi:hypothetical protein
MPAAVPLGYPGLPPPWPGWTHPHGKAPHGGERFETARAPKQREYPCLGTLGDTAVPSTLLSTPKPRPRLENDRLALSTLDHALAVAESGLRIFPLPPLRKAPPPVGWQDLATTDPIAIHEFFRNSPNANYGIRTGAVNDLIVVDLDGAEAQSWWRERGLTTGAVVRTPSGLDRSHHYFRVTGIELPNSQSKIAPHVDVRGEGGYVVGPGSVLPTGTYAGSLTDIPDASPELIAAIPEKQAYVSELREGDKVEAASDAELRQIQSGIAALDQLPQPWVEGAGWRSTFYRVACWFSRMANSPDYAMTQAGALSILLEHAPSDSGWGEPEQLQQWQSALKTTAGQYAEPVTAAYPMMLKALHAQHLPNFPKLTSTGKNLTEDVLNIPASDDEVVNATRRRMIYAEAILAGMDKDHAANVVFMSTVGKDRFPIPREFWEEIEAIRASPTGELDLDSGAAPAKSTRITLLTPEERAEVEADDTWFGARYLAWAKSTVPLLNPPYHRMNALMLLSLVFSDVGFAVPKSGPIALNLFGTILGDSTTGKSEALFLLDRCIDYHFKDDSPNIGGDASGSALTEKLIERDGKPSLFLSDEAHGLFKQMAGDNSWMVGLKEKLTELFDGKVRQKLRTGNKDISGRKAVTYFNTYFMGTVAQMVDVLDEGFWTSGLGNRMIWAVGAPVEPDDSTYEAEQIEDYSPATYDQMPRQWSAEFLSAKETLRSVIGTRGKVVMDTAALARQSKMKKFVNKTLPHGHEHERLLKPAMIRLEKNVWKVAALVAMSRGSEIITLHDELIAIEAGEEWLNNIVELIGTTTASHSEREATKIEVFIAGKKRPVEPYEIYKFSSRPKTDVDKSLDQLEAEKRIVRDPPRLEPRDKQPHTWRLAA